MKSMLCTLALLVTVCSMAHAQSLPAADVILARSIAYHGMDKAWDGQHHRITLRETRPDGNDRRTVLDLDHRSGRFGLQVERDGHQIEASVKEDACTATLDDTAEMPEDLRKRYRLSCDGVQWWRSYYGYLYGLPVKLKDPGTRLAPEVQQGTFQERDVLVLKVTYDAEVGSDTWYFYLDPTTYALVGCRFYHDEAQNDGEYIVFDGEVRHDGVRFSKTRSWYTNAEDRFLGSDIIEAYVHVPPPDAR